MLLIHAQMRFNTPSIFVLASLAEMWNAQGEGFQGARWVRLRSEPLAETVETVFSTSLVWVHLAEARCYGEA